MALLFFLAATTVVYPLYFKLPPASYIASERWTTLSTLALLATAFILLLHKPLVRAFSLRRSLAAAVFLFAALAFAQAIHFDKYCLDDLGFSLFWIAIPLFVYLLAPQARKLIPLYFAFMWAFNFVQVFWQDSGELTGVAGNRNWHASFLVVTAGFTVYLLLFQFFKDLVLGSAPRPGDKTTERGLVASLPGSLVWLTSVCLASMVGLAVLGVYACRDFSARFAAMPLDASAAMLALAVLVFAFATALFCRGRLGWLKSELLPRAGALDNERRYLKLATGIMVGVACLIVLTLSCFYSYLCESRGTWLSLAVTAYMFLCLYQTTVPFLRRHVLKRFLVYSALCVFAACSVVSYLYPEKVVEKAYDTYQEDVRIPLWMGNLMMVKDNPLLGVGSSRFESVYGGYRPIPYFLRSVSAVRSNHSHNAFLFIAGSYGVLGALLWLFLWLWPVVAACRRFPKLSAYARLSLFAYVVLFIHGQLDLILFEWPTIVFAAILLGALWREIWPFKEFAVAVPEPQAVGAGMLLRPGRRAALVVAAVTSVTLLGFTAQLIHDEAVGSYYFRSGRYYDDTNSPDEAMANYDKALSYKQYDRFIYKAGIVALTKLDNPALALRYFSLFDYTPAFNFAHRPGFMALARRKLGELKEALPYLELETHNYPILVGSWFNLAKTQQALGMRAEAKASFAQMSRAMVYKGLDPNNSAMLMLLLTNPEYDMHPGSIPAAKLQEAAQAKRVAR